MSTTPSSTISNKLTAFHRTHGQARFIEHLALRAHSAPFDERLELVKTIHKFFPQHFSVVYAAFVSSAFDNLVSYSYQEILENVCFWNQPTAKQDVEKLLANVDPNIVPLLPALTHAVNHNNTPVVETLLAARRWSARPLATLLPFVLHNDNPRLVHAFLTHPGMSDKREVLFYILSQNEVYSSLGIVLDKVMDTVLDHLSAADIAHSLNSYQQAFKKSGAQVQDDFLAHLRARGQHKGLTQEVEGLLSAAPFARKPKL